MSTNPTIELRGVSKHFAGPTGPRSVFEGVDLAAAPGGFLSILGPSGCGKSTLLRLIAGLDHPTGGTVRVNGDVVTRPGRDRGVVFQEPRLLPWRTVRGNIALGLVNADLPKAQRRELAEEHIALVGLEGFADAYPFQLSGGMAQRVAIARALVNRPQVLLLDEPFSALDPMTRAALQDVLMAIWAHERLTVVMITHDVEEAVYLSDHVAVMRAGKPPAHFAIDLPRARDRDGFDFAAVKRRVGEALRGEIVAPEPQTVAPLTAGARLHAIKTN